jgi:hypothetical protein
MRPEPGTPTDITVQDYEFQEVYDLGEDSKEIAALLWSGLSPTCSIAQSGMPGRH